jgi:hypothetical protein
MNIRNLLNKLHGLNRNWLLHGSGQVLLIGLASRLLVFTSAIIGFSVFGPRQPLPNENLWNISVPIVNLFSRWDTGFYAPIALYGYPSGSNPVGQQWAWFPLYPLMMKAVGPLFSGFLSPNDAVIVAGFLISNVLFFVSLMLFYKISKMVLGNSRLAIISTIFFSFWPGALFYSAVYSESLFMALALGAFYFLEKGESKKSTLLGFLAGFARSNGFLIFIPFLFYGLQKRRYQPILQSILVASPYLWFNLYGYFSTGLFPAREIAFNYYWGKTSFLLNQINTINEGFTVLFSAEVLLIIFPFCMLFFRGLQLRSFSQTLKTEGKALKYWAFSLVTLIVILFFSSVFSIQRYAIPMLPLYWVSAQTWGKNQKLGILLLIIMATILIVGSILFATWRLYC